jgi:Protein of unknown function (DUF1385)
MMFMYFHNFDTGLAPCGSWGVTFLSIISIGYELFKLNPQKRIVQPFYVLGGFIQKYIVTSEPKDEEIELAIVALKRAIRLENMQSNLELVQGDRSNTESIDGYHTPFNVTS